MIEVKTRVITITDAFLFINVLVTNSFAFTIQSLHNNLLSILLQEHIHQVGAIAEVDLILLQKNVVDVERWQE